MRSTALKWLFILLLSSFTLAQEPTAELKQRINYMYNKMQIYKQTTPAWKQYVDAGMAAGNYCMSVGEWAKAINCFNKVLKIVPNYSAAILKRNFCRKQLTTKRLR